MNIAYNFKNFDPSPHLKDYAANRFAKLDKYVNNQDEVDIQVNLAVEKFRQIAEVVLTGDTLHISAAEESQDMYAAIDLILDKVVAQLKKIREKKHNTKRNTAQSVRLEVFSLTPSEDGTRERTIVESDSFEPKPMDVEEAAMQLESLNYDFLVFHNAESERINVIYRRRNGDFGLIDPGVH
jgi:putative sigma-54 modulation protein